MRYVILRDDDTNALTPVECLERLYRPFLDRGMPVNLAVIPSVATSTTRPTGELEGFLFARNGACTETVSIGNNPALVRYLRENTGFRIVQHGFRHRYFEFDTDNAADASAWLEEGRRQLLSAGLPEPDAFVAPYDRYSAASLKECARRFRVISGGWYELRRLPRAWWPRYVWKKLRGEPHWRVGRTLLLSHPGCLLSCQRPYDSMLDNVIDAVRGGELTVLVTHWWEYFWKGRPNEAFIGRLHAVAEYLASQKDVRVISFSDLGA
ncbi:MAG TPA: DUF2334 domain-containing protein [Verrucomicrobia bacterium]|nr:DUF2334 domain-containing protein [Verrucomicrobiota bacterium]HOP97961.1 DUF2334 domain-containing protein [Verrucomicrobiota bacterium]HPU56063.1 DUF2334 domain-containing protein [Verrucomicrobiota bacterium]